LNDNFVISAETGIGLLLYGISSNVFSNKNVYRLSNNEPIGGA
jgi:hypothetical protein